MDHTTRQGMQFIAQMRAQGMSDEMIRQQLLGAGWPMDVVQRLMISAMRTQSAPVKKSSGLLLSLVIGLVVVLAVGAGGAVWYLTSQQQEPENHGATQSQQQQDETNPGVQTEPPGTSGGEELLATFTDSNFSIDLPQSWFEDSKYKTGAEQVSFFSPEHLVDENREKAATMKISVSTDMTTDRLAKRLESITQQGGTYQAAMDEPIFLGGKTGRIIDIVYTTAQQPDKQVRLMMLDVPGTSMRYFVEVTGNNAHWETLHAAKADMMLRSFRQLR